MISSPGKINTLLGYAWNRSFGPYSLPVKHQNLLCKDYTTQKKLIYGPAQGEPIFCSNHIQLRTMILDLNKNEGIVMLSMYMLPKEEGKRLQIYNMILKKKTELHFVIENNFFKSKKDMRIEEILKYLSITKQIEKIFEKLNSKKLLKI
jgi:sporadic carbohydrate cluster protein (TIGR04323 family)